MRKWLLLIIAVGLLVAFFFNFYHFLKARASTSEFKSQTEHKIGQILNASVKIGHIRFGLLKHVSLSGLVIDQSKSKLPVQIGIRKITIKYDLLAFLKQKFKIPTEVALDQPTFDFKSLISPFSLTKSAATNLLGPKGSVFKRIDLENGEMQFPLPFLNQKLAVDRIKGKAFLDSDEILHLDFRAKAAQMLEGDVKVSGEMNPDKKISHLRIDLENVHATDEKKIPLRDINGSLELSETELRIPSLTFLLRGVSVKVSGTVHNPFTPKPAWNLSIEVNEGRKKLSLESQADIAKETISGTLNLFGLECKFKGNLTVNQSGFEFQGIQFNNGYRANGEFNIQKGFYLVKAERGLQRFGINLDLHNFKIDLDLDVNHLKIFDHDLTAFSKIKANPLEPGWTEGDKRFAVELNTDYFIFDYHPLKDFRANFNLSEAGLEAFTAEWGNVCHMKGSFAFSEVPSFDFTIAVDAFKLSELPALGLHPMPVSLEGMLEGKIHAIGAVQKPDVSGNFSIDNGKIGNFKFDHADLSFYGTPPYLSLLDSKILRKDNTFLIKGDIDLSLVNIFQKIKIVSVDQIVIWKGLDVTSEIQSRSELVRSNASLNSAPTASGTGSRGGAEGGRKIEAEYSITDHGSLSVTAEESEGKQHLVTVGPKVRF